MTIHAARLRLPFSIISEQFPAKNKNGVYKKYIYAYICNIFGHPKFLKINCNKITTVSENLWRAFDQFS